MMNGYIGLGISKNYIYVLYLILINLLHVNAVLEAEGSVIHTIDSQLNLYTS